MFDWVGRAGLVAILCGLSMTASVAETLSRYSLDAMLAGFTDGCSRSPELEAYWGSVISDEAPVLPEPSASLVNRKLGTMTSGVKSA